MDTEDLLAEEWKKIPNYDDYEISSLGRVKKTVYLRSHTSKSVGYPHIQLFAGDGNGKRSLIGKSHMKKALMHRLIAQAFIDNPNNHKVVNHKDGDKLNFSIDNLEWCTASENMYHAYKIGLRKNNPVKRMVVELKNDFTFKIWNGYRDIANNGNTWNKAYYSIRSGSLYKKSIWHYLNFYCDYTDNVFFTKENGIMKSVTLDFITSQVSEEYLSYQSKQKS